MTELRQAALALYMAGRWSCDRPVDEAALWGRLRDALDLPEGTATRAGVAAQAIEACQRQDAKTGLARKGESAVRQDAPKGG